MNLIQAANESCPGDPLGVRPGAGRELGRDSGVSLIETMVAVGIALVGVFSLSSVIVVASLTDKNQGTEATRATVYAQDKMEKLLSLDFFPQSVDPSSCIQPSGSQPASCNTTGITAGNWTQGLLAGGSLTPLEASCGSGTPGYQDFLDASGAQILASGCDNFAATAAYVRQWQIVDVTPPAGGPALKQISVAVYSLNANNTLGGTPIVVVSSVLTSPY